MRLQGMEMKLSTVGTAIVMTALIVGCGGSADNSAMATTYNFVTPQINSQRAYRRVIIDNSNNNLVEAFVGTVVNANADGSYIVMEDDSNRTKLDGR